MVAQPVMTNDQDQLWNLSLHIFSDETISNDCLDIQKKNGLDLSFLFWLCWIGIYLNRELTADEIQRSLGYIGYWRSNVIETLRWLRKEMKENIEPVKDQQQQSLRVKVRELEVESEQLEQLALIEYAKTIGTEKDGNNAVNNMRTYFKLIEGDVDKEIEMLIQRIYSNALSFKKREVV